MTGLERWSKYRTSIGDSWYKYKNNKLGVFALIILFGFALVAALAPYIATDPMSLAAKNVAPSFSPPAWLRVLDPTIPQDKVYGILGTDDLGRDVLSQVVYGSRISLVVGITAATIAVTIGLFIGLLSGYFGGLIDTLLMRITDMVLSLPALVILIAIASILGHSIANIIILIGLMWWTGTARTVRSQVLTLKERKFVEASKSLGAGGFYIVKRHILPNVASLLFSNFTLATAYAIITEAGISFMGLGDQNVISWGLMIYDAFHFRAFLVNAWWYFIPPGICISLVVLSFISIGQALDQVFNPRLRMPWWEK